MTDRDNTRHQLYRHFDGAGNLLYIGISLNAMYRLSQHRLQSGWFDDIARMEIENFPSRAELEQAEILAIKNESPLHNVVHATPEEKKKAAKARKRENQIDVERLTPEEKDRHELVQRYVNISAEWMSDMLLDECINLPDTATVASYDKSVADKIRAEEDRQIRIGIASENSGIT